MPNNREREQRRIRAVRALVVLDPTAGFHTTQDDEFGRILQVYDEDHDLKLDATLKDVLDPADAERADMIVFDWGAMSLGNDLLGHRIRAVTRWAEDHHTALVIIRSMPSWNELQDEIRDEQLPALPNNHPGRRPHADPDMVARHRKGQPLHASLIRSHASRKFQLETSG